MVDIASTTARRQVHVGVCEQISVLAGSPSMASITIWTEAMRVELEAAEAVAEEVAAHSTRAPLSTETQRQLTEFKAPRHDSRAALQAGLEFLQRQ